MIVILSPAKRLNFNQPNTAGNYTIPGFLDESEQIAGKLKKLSSRGIKKLMNINADLAGINYDRYQEWERETDETSGHPAILAFRGDVYLGIDPDTFVIEDFDFAQEYIRILSGLYGLLKPLDLIRPYRLEMGTRLKIGRKPDLYAFWKDILTNSLTVTNGFQRDRTLINLASKEYFGAIDQKKLNGRIIEPVFLDYKNGQYKPIHLFLKKARGFMTSYIVRNKITDPENLKLFNMEGYEYNDRLSDKDQWVFTRG